MDPRTEIREFLASRRARITPAQAGLPDLGGHRRVPGLRREEVALLAGVSVDYYVRLERGHVAGASEAVLDALARALALDEAERAHLFDLARAAAGRPERPQVPERVRPGVQRVLDALVDAPAFVRNGRFDVLAVNRLGRALYDPVLDEPAHGANTARFTFLDPRAREFYADWERAADDAVAILRGETGRSPDDRALAELVAELSAGSDVFRARWAAHDVRNHSGGVKRFRHPVVGELTFSYEVMELRADPGLAMFVYSAEPDSPSADGLRLLASWSATLEHTPS